MAHQEDYSAPHTRGADRRGLAVDRPPGATARERRVPPVSSAWGVGPEPNAAQASEASIYRHNAAPNFTQASATDPRLRYAISSATQQAPRFLFRMWLEGTPSARTEDTQTGVTPAMFQTLGDHRPIFSIPERELNEVARTHLYGDQTRPSYFSTWTHSWQQLTQKFSTMLRDYPEEQMTKVHISIIDTKLLSPENVVLSSSFFHERHKPTADIPHQFLVYGHITGAAYRTVSIGGIMDTGALLNVSVGSWPHYARIDDAIDAAQRFGSCFGDYFALPVAVTILSFPADKFRRNWATGSPSLTRIVRALEHYHVPQEWARDFTVVAESAYAPGFDDFARSNLLMQELIARQYAGPSMDDMAVALSRMDVHTRRYGTASLLSIDAIKETDTASYQPSSWADTDETMSEASAASDGTLNGLPPGRMDDETKRKVMDARRKTPRFLFRSWDNSRYPSGGHHGLNTPAAITPLAFKKNTVPADTTIFDLNSSELQDMTSAHLTGKYHPQTQFSSWASSLQVAFHFVRAGADCYISVIDAQQLAEKNVILHVPLMKFLGPLYGYDHEYLAHGIIEGSAHKAVPLKAFNDIGVGLSRAWKTNITPRRSCVPNAFPEITVAELRAAMKVAKRYGDDFVVAVALAILCQKQRDGDLWRCGNIKELNMIALGLKDYKIPEDWCQELSILTDIVYTRNGYGDVEQMVHLLRSLLNYWLGKQARSRSRSAFRDPDAPEPQERKKNVHWPEEMDVDEDGTTEERRGRGRANARHIAA